MSLIEIKTNHLSDKGKLQINARDVWFLVQHLPLILHQRISTLEKKHYDFALQITAIWDMLLLEHFNDFRLDQLQDLISKHNSSYQELYNNTLKPKHHFMLHYSEVIKRSGPLR